MTAIAMLQTRDSGMVGLLLNILPIAVIVLVLYFFVIARVNKQRRNTQEMLSYDAQVIVTFAARLYKQADSIAATYAIVGALVGACIGAAVGNASGGSAFIGLAIGAVLTGAVAFNIGQQKAFTLRLQAQIALCQVQIEANTRRS